MTGWLTLILLSAVAAMPQGHAWVPPSMQRAEVAAFEHRYESITAPALRQWECATDATPDTFSKFSIATIYTKWDRTLSATLQAQRRVAKVAPPRLLGSRDRGDYASALRFKNEGYKFRTAGFRLWLEYLESDTFNDVIAVKSEKQMTLAANRLGRGDRIFEAIRTRHGMKPMKQTKIRC
jgi:hypothetical protein